MNDLLNTKGKQIAPEISGATSVLGDTKKPLYKVDVAAQKDFVLNSMAASPVFTGSESEYESLSNYGAQPTMFQNQSDLERIRAKNQSAWKQAGNSIVQMAGSVVGDTVGGFGMIADIATGALWDDNAYSNPLTELGDTISEGSRKLAPIYRTDPDKAIDLNDFSGWFFSQLPSVASSLALMIPGKAFTNGVTILGRGALKGLQTSSKLAKAINNVEKFAKLDNIYNAQRVKSLTESGLTAIGMRLGENYQESRATAQQMNTEALDTFYKMTDNDYNKWISENQDIVDEAGSSDKEVVAKTIATKAADRSFNYNSLNVVFDFFQLRSLNSAFKGMIDKPLTSSVKYAQKDALNKLASSGLSSTGEGLKKTIGNTVSDIATIIGRKTRASGQLMLAELSEGVEEAVNFIGGEEGSAYGNYLLSNDKKGYADVSAERLQNYMANPHLYNAALWGVIGGVVFGGAMNGINNVVTKRKGGLTEDQQRIAEINGREQVFNKYSKDLNTIRNGFNPYEVENDKDGNAIYYKDDGSTTTDSKLGIQRNTNINSPEEQSELLNETKNRFATNIALNAIAAGNYELLEDYITSPQIRKKMIDDGLASPETYDIDTQELVAQTRSVLDSYKKYSSILKNANVEDSYLDIALQENVINEQEIKLIDKRLERLENRNQELINNIPELQQFQLDNTNQTLKLSILQQARKQLYMAYNEVKDSKNALDRVNATDFKDRINAIDSMMESVTPLLSPAESLANRMIKKLTDEFVGVENKDLVAQEIEEFIKSDESKKLFGEASSALSSNKRLDIINSINSEYVDNMQSMLLDGIRKEVFNNRLSTTEAKVESQVSAIKDSTEKAANYKKQKAEQTVIDSFAAATDENISDLQAIIDGTITEERLNEEATLKDIAIAVLILKLSSDNIDEINELLNNELSKVKAKVKRDTAVTSPVKESNVVVDPYDAAINAPIKVLKTPIEIAEPIVDKSSSEKLNTIVDSLVNTDESVLITDASISNYNLDIKNSFTSTSVKNGRPIKIKYIQLAISKFGNVSINGFVTNTTSNGIDADVTIEEINEAIAKGDITATLKDDIKESTLEEGVNGEQIVATNVANSKDRNDSMKLIFSLYADAVSTESINGVPVISLESLMRHIQNRNPKAISLYESLKTIALELNREGSIILNDSDNLLRQDKKEFSKTIATSDKAKIEKVAKETSKTNNFGIALLSPDFTNMDKDNSKLYKTIMSLKKGDRLMIRLENGRLNSYSGKVMVGSIPIPNVDINNNPTVINEHWKYTSVKDKVGYKIGFIESLKSLVTSTNEVDQDLVSAIYKLKAINNSIRYNPDNKKLLDQVLNELEENQSYKGLVSLYGESLESFDDKLIRANHISKILMYDRNINPKSTNYGELISESLNVWTDKVGSNYNRMFDLYKSISKSKRQSKSIVVDNTSTGRLLLANNENGKPKYNNIDSVLTAESTDNFQLYGIDNGQIIIRDGSKRKVGESTNISDNGNTILYIKDSEGRPIRVNTQGNTANNSLTKSNSYTDAFNNGMSELFDALAGSLLNRDLNTFETTVTNIEQYIGSGKTLYGYEFGKTPDGNYIFKPKASSRGVISEKFNGPIIYFNIASQYPNIKFKYPDGTVTPAMGITTSKGIDVSKSSRNNFNSKFPELLNYLKRNIINEAANYNLSSLEAIKNPTVRFSDGRLETKIPSLSNDTWFEESYSSYGEFAIKTGLLVTNVDAIKDSKGNILGNFVNTDVGHNSIGLNKNIYVTLEKSNKLLPTSPVEDSTDIIATTVTNGTTITELAKQFNIREYDAILQSLEDAGLAINPVIETGVNRFANINLGTNTITLSDKWLGLDNTQKLLKIVHEGVHYYLRQEGVDIDSFKDLYDRFKEVLEAGRDNNNISDEAYNLYSKYLFSTKDDNIKLEEFVVEALTSREFARLLSSIPYKSGKTKSDSIFNKLIEAIVKLIGDVTSIDNTILGEINNRLSSIVNDTKIKTEESVIAEVDNEAINKEIDFNNDEFLSDSYSDLDGLDFDSTIIDNNAKLTPSMQSLFSRLNASTIASVNSLQASGKIIYSCS